MANNQTIHRGEVLLWTEPTTRGIAAAAKIVKELGYDARHAKALRYVVKLAAAGRPLQMTAWQEAIDAAPTTARRVLVRLAVDGLIAVRGIDDPATPDAVREYVAEHRETGKPESEPEPAAADES